MDTAPFFTPVWRPRAVVAFALAGLLTAVGGGPTAAQFVTSTEPAVAVTGFGEATAPAETAAVQVLVREAFDESQYGDMGMIEVDSAMAATPVPEAVVTEERLAPLGEAAVAAGADQDAIDVFLNPIAPDSFNSRGGVARIDFTVAAPTVEQLSSMATAMSDAATADGLAIEAFAVEYRVADCGPLAEEASRTAVAKAAERAAVMADLLSVETGEVVAASDFSGIYGPTPTSGNCASREGTFFSSGYGGLETTFEEFDRSAPAEVSTAAQISVSYAIVAESAP